MPDALPLQCEPEGAGDEASNDGPIAVIAVPRSISGSIMAVAFPISASVAAAASLALTALAVSFDLVSIDDLAVWPFDALECLRSIVAGGIQRRLSRLVGSRFLSAPQGRIDPHDNPIRSCGAHDSSFSAIRA